MVRLQVLHAPGAHTDHQRIISRIFPGPGGKARPGLVLGPGSPGEMPGVSLCSCCVNTFLTGSYRNCISYKRENQHHDPTDNTSGQKPTNVPQRTCREEKQRPVCWGFPCSSVKQVLIKLAGVFQTCLLFFPGIRVTESSLFLDLFFSFLFSKFTVILCRAELLMETCTKSSFSVGPFIIHAPFLPCVPTMLISFSFFLTTRAVYLVCLLKQGFKNRYLLQNKCYFFHFIIYSLPHL